MPDVPYLLPASSWARGMRKDGSLPTPNFPPHVTHVAADSGGFVATLKWGGYRYSHEQYMNWLERIGSRLQWAAMMDFCCEKEIAATCGIVAERQWLTTEMAHLFWSLYRDAHWAWVPTIQGWDVEDYRRHATAMKPLIDEMSKFYAQRGQSFSVGIGTLCARANVSMILEVIASVRGVLPDVQFHLWGVKLGALQSKLLDLSVIASVDSAAWGGHFGSDIKEIRSARKALGMSKTEYDYKVSLPRYLDKVSRAVTAPKQTSLF
jgi:hypothetical protein